VWGAFHKTECPLARSSYFGRCWPADWPPYGHWFDSNVGRPGSAGAKVFQQSPNISITINLPNIFISSLLSATTFTSCPCG
jgi:hypothetical protein